MKNILNTCVLLIFILSLSFGKLKAQIYCEGDSILLNALDYVTGDVQWQRSLDNVIWYDLPGANTLTYMIHPVTDYHYRLKISDTACMYPYYTTSQLVAITPLPSVANAGSNQLNLAGTSTYLSANTPVAGNGVWSITSGTGGSFNNILNPTTPFTGVSGIIYTLRWTISNACGTSYDEVQISFSNAFVCGDTLLDTRDGQKYATVLIGSQCWLKRDMNYGQYINTVNPQTNNSIIEKYCYDNNTSHCDYYGALYTWDEAMQYTTNESVQGICPSGWHIPSDNEVKILEMALGMTQAEADLGNTWRGVGVGTSLKLGGASGFNAVFGGGLWGSGGSSLFMGQMYYVWTSTQSGSSNAWRRCLSSTDDKVGRWDSFPKYYGFSVRCVKN